ncbi:hypothetical protein, conserved [Eimeria brunetti]|uniref:Protein MEMO1 n=1 Tax=Eimeria brunetti TaxID=51314 RepID=U6LE45_9EIME|nr:hypothetical protein, conserved [Eimeria brunetti]
MERSRGHQRQRRATHAGTWYDADCTNLSAQIRRWIHRASRVCEGRLKALICPKRVFLLGPSHYKYFKGVALPSDKCSVYATPLGDLPLDTDTLDALRQSGAFSEVSLAEDEEEHSIELMLPFVRYIFSEGVKIVPMIVGDLKSLDDCRKFADLLLNYFVEDGLRRCAIQENLFIISSDFCHWGPRYSYFYLEEPQPEVPIHATIEKMDRKAVKFITEHQGQGFYDYLEATGLSVCGRHPISLFLLLLERASANQEDKFSTQLIAYSQSSQAQSRNDSSVSYAALCTTRV